ncbi:MAG TPA: c-type cytochrome [Sulfurovum sp.]|nr:c-type cytochrome [Sulfurovum sp.]
MKKITLLSLVAATLLFTACDEKTKNEISDATSSVTSSVKDAASKVADKAGDIKDAAIEKAGDAVDATKDAASKVADKASNLKDAAVEKAGDVVDATKDAAAEVTASVDNAAGKAAYAKCAGCHGADGKTQALGKSAVIAGQSVETLVTSINEYKAGTRNVTGMGMLMKGQAASLSDDDIQAVSEYISAM